MTSEGAARVDEPARIVIHARSSSSFTATCTRTCRFKIISVVHCWKCSHYKTLLNNIRVTEIPDILLFAREYSKTIQRIRHL